MLDDGIKCCKLCSHKEECREEDPKHAYMWGVCSRFSYDM